MVCSRSNLLAGCPSFNLHTLPGSLEVHYAGRSMEASWRMLGSRVSCWAPPGRGDKVPDFLSPMQKLRDQARTTEMFSRMNP